MRARYGSRDTASIMSGKNTHKAATRLTLKSQLAELSRVWPWVDALAAEYDLPEETHFAIDLCLEEALSNIIRHGYRGQPDHDLAIDFTSLGTSVTFVIEDQALHYAPGEPTEAQPANSIEEYRPGGLGVQLMRRFAGTLHWEPLPHGNRLTIGFTTAQPPGK
jgi:anti-sigma regulatory factor (Ser/Thr protein kinase)